MYLTPLYFEVWVALEAFVIIIVSTVCFFNTLGFLPIFLALFSEFQQNFLVSTLKEILSIPCAAYKIDLIAILVRICLLVLNI